MYDAILSGFGAVIVQRAPAVLGHLGVVTVLYICHAVFSSCGGGESKGRCTQAQ